MKRVLVLSAVLAAAAIGLVWWLSQSSTDEPSPRGAERPRQAPTTQPRTGGGDPEASAGGATETSTTPSAPLDGGVSRPRVYAVGDVIVRDHRGPDAPPLTEIEVKPPGGHLIKGETAQRVVEVLEPPARECLGGGGPKQLSVTMTVEVKNSFATVSGVTGAGPGIEDSVVEQTLQCMRARMIGKRIDASGETDVPSYPITTVYSAP